MVRYESFDRAAPILVNAARDSSGKIICFYYVPRTGTAFSGNNINYDFGTSIDVKRTVSKSHNQKSVLHCKGLRGLKGIPGSTTIKQTARKYN